MLRALPRAGSALLLWCCVSMATASADDGDVREVTVNGKPALSLRPNFAEWEITLTDRAADTVELTAGATDAAGNAEQTPHKLLLSKAK